MTATEEPTCDEKIYNNYAMHKCGRKLKGDSEFPKLCGLHISAIRRRRAKDEERKRLAQERGSEMATAESRQTAIRDKFPTLQAGIETSTPYSGTAAFIPKPTGKVIVDLDALEDLLAKLTPPTPGEIRIAAENAHDSGYPNDQFGPFWHGFTAAVAWLGRSPK